MDEADQAGDEIEKVKSQGIAAIRKAAADIPVGSSGICEYCEEQSQRLVNDACARCGDKYKLL